ncbi:MAG: undecaprenyl-diphosphate phosphatase [Actinomycetota bacterium]
MFRAAVLGLFQGLTEFVPVSSSAHIVLVPFLLRWPAPDLAFDVSVHLGTALAVIVYFARDLGRIAAGSVRWAVRKGSAEDRVNSRLLGLLAIASVPAGIAGIFLEGLFEDLFTGTEQVDDIGAPVTALFLLVTAGLLWTAERLYARGTEERRRGIEDIRLVDAIVVGLFQAVAIAPGISRSGATISAGVFRGLRRDAAARFSFLMSLPAIVGAGIISLPDVPAGADWSRLAVGAGVSALAGFAAIATLMRYLRTRTMRPFAVYCVLFAAVALAFWSQIR